MFDSIKRFFAIDTAEAHPEIDPHVAATALLVEAALADGIYADCEQDQISHILGAAFGMAPEKAARVLDQAEALAETAVDHHRFTKVVKACLDKQERIALLEQLWARRAGRWREIPLRGCLHPAHSATPRGGGPGTDLRAFTCRSPDAAPLTNPALRPMSRPHTIRPRKSGSHDLYRH